MFIPLGKQKIYLKKFHDNGDTIRSLNPANKTKKIYLHFFRPLFLKTMFIPLGKQNIYLKKFHDNGDTNRIGWEIQCLRYAAFLVLILVKFVAKIKLMDDIFSTDFIWPGLF